MLVNNVKSFAKLLEASDYRILRMGFRILQLPTFTLLKNSHVFNLSLFSVAQ